MIFWVIAAVLTLGASLAVLLPLASGAKSAMAAGARHDLEVYRDQLSELDRDLRRGLIQPAEADQARAEIGRRILRLDESRAGAEADALPAPKALRLASVAAVLAVPLISWGLYVQLGSPELPSQPLSARITKSPADSSVGELIARAEAHLAANPTDGRGWDVLAPIYLRLQRFPDAVTAYRNAIRLEGATAARQAGLGEAIAGAAGGVVSAEAQAAFEAALQIEPANPKAGFYLAMALAQDGREKEAEAAWRKMLPTLPAESAWRGAVEQALAAAGAEDAPMQGTAGGPSEADMAAAAAMSPQDRTEMIETMVAGLDEKLRRDPRNRDGWIQLIRSFAVLGEQEQARDALRRGIAAFGAGSEEAGKLTDFAASLGLEASE